MSRPPRTLVLNYLLKMHLVATTEEAMHVSNEIVTILEEAGHLQPSGRAARGGGLLSSQPGSEDVQGDTRNSPLMDSRRGHLSERAANGKREQVTVVHPAL